MARTGRREHARVPGPAGRAKRPEPATRRADPSTDAFGGRRAAAAALLLVVMTVAAYAPALRDGFIWDDDQYITANVTLRSLDGLRRIWVEPGAVPQYYPLTFTTFWIEYHLWGAQPPGYHAVNVVLHAVNAVLLWLLLRRLRVPGAWVAAAVFALHPMQVESVAWITERKNVLSGFFALSAALLYVARVTWRSYVAVCVLFVCALFSKTVTCTLPAVLLLLAWWRRGAVDRRAVVPLVPMLVVGMFSASMTVWMERHHVGAAGEEWALSFLERGLVAGRALWFYPRTLLWPTRLTFIYPRWTIDPGVWWQYVFPAAALGVVVALYASRARVGRGPLVAALCYAGGLVPALGFFNVFPMRFSFVADHFAYLPIVGVIVLITAAGTDLVQRAGAGRRQLAYAICAPIFVSLAVLTARQCAIYHDMMTLWTDTLAKNPNCWLAHSNLGDMLSKQGATAAATRHFEAALELKPNDPDVHYNLGTALLQAGERSRAVEHFEETIRLRPDYPNAHNNLGGVLFESGRVTEALEHYERALQLKPDFPEAHNNLGTVLSQTGEVDRAIGHFEQAIRLQPRYAQAQANLGRALLQVGRRQEAIAHLQEALRLNPRDADARAYLETAQQ